MPCSSHEVLGQCDSHGLGSFLMPLMKADPELLTRSAAAMPISVEQLLDTLRAAITHVRAPPILRDFLNRGAAGYNGYLDGMRLVINDAQREQFAAQREKMGV